MFEKIGQYFDCTFIRKITRVNMFLLQCNQYIK